MIYLLNGQQTERLIFRNVSLNDFNEWIAFFKDPETSRHWESEKEDPGTDHAQ